MNLNSDGIVVGIAALIIIGIFHPIVIKCEYYFTQKVWPLFCFVGIIFLIVSLFLQDVISIIMGIAGVVCLWSIKEIKDQAVRVQKGWFPSNPKRADAGSKG
ncbi:DUF4491 family protein [Lachnospiraceae bacterium 54-53]